jgi:hypothetical protein
MRTAGGTNQQMNILGKEVLMHTNKKFPIIGLLSVLALLILTVSGHAAEWTAWTFQVPVELTNVPSTINKGCVVCTVCAEPGATDTQCQNVGHIHRTDFDIVNRGFSGTITVPVNTKDGIDPYSAKSWACKVLLYVNNMQALVSQAMTPDPSKPQKSVVYGTIK